MIAEPQPKREKKVERSAPKTKLEILEPGDVVKVAKLFMKGQAEKPWAYPNLASASPQDLAAWLLFVITQPNFTGVLVRVGRDPVGFLLGQYGKRPIGTPRVYLHLISGYLDPAHRSPELYRSAVRELFARAEANGIRHWESNVSDRFLGEFIPGPYGPIQLEG